MISPLCGDRAPSRKGRKNCRCRTKEQQAAGVNGESLRPWSVIRLRTRRQSSGRVSLAVSALHSAQSTFDDSSATTRSVIHRLAV
ncbi:unnamed protein product [Macrosiphum euphorbiae]|uniref:Uncharacterized protein n=1 Tax=Macrosiphum euphorbiae TaxID=13131 RepID=A0AAV0XFF8_9HEMI|nr:unnamed protein product [Macrosiphum euphorbiae]